MRNQAQNMNQKASDSFLILVNNPKHPLHARYSFKNKFFERRWSKKIIKISFQPSLF